jgi:hypothetical protein
MQCAKAPSGQESQELRTKLELTFPGGAWLLGFLALSFCFFASSAEKRERRQCVSSVSIGLHLWQSSSAFLRVCLRPFAPSRFSAPRFLRFTEHPVLSIAFRPPLSYDSLSRQTEHFPPFYWRMRKEAQQERSNVGGPSKNTQGDGR